MDTELDSGPTPCRADEYRHGDQVHATVDRSSLSAQECCCAFPVHGRVSSTNSLAQIDHAALRQWRNIGIPLAVAVLVAVIIFQFGTGSYVFVELAAWTVGVSSAVSVYVVFGLIERRFTGTAREATAGNPVSLIRALFRSSSGPVQLLRLGLNVYAGLPIHAVAYNAMFSPYAVRNISVVTGIVAASLVAILLYSKGATPPTQDSPIR